MIVKHEVLHFLASALQTSLLCVQFIWKINMHISTFEYLLAENCVGCCR